jgi:hypothetical protein
MIRLILASACLGLFLGFSTGEVSALSKEDVPRITVHELKAKLDRGEKVIILDMRVGGSYTKSKLRIKNDVRMSLETVGVRAKELPMGFEIVIYCT